MAMPDDTSSGGRTGRRTTHTKLKSVIVVLYEEKIVMECPFCGQTLIRTDYKKVQKLLAQQDSPRGKVCSKCNGVVLLRLNEKTKKVIEDKLSEMADLSRYDATVKIDYE